MLALLVMALSTTQLLQNLGDAGSRFVVSPRPCFADPSSLTMTLLNA
jgi:hypothetical protein